jgi:hypothetical protein
MTQVGGAFVRIRPFVAEEDARALAALDRLTHEIAAAFDRFRDEVSASGTRSPLTILDRRQPE